MSKNIVFCADGTWSGLGQGDGDDRVQAAATNVLRLFAALGTRRANSVARAGTGRKRPGRPSQGRRI